jgi:hypothetical protein
LVGVVPLLLLALGHPDPAVRVSTGQDCRVGVSLAHPELCPVHLLGYSAVVLRQYIAERWIDVAKDLAEPNL